MKEQMNIKLIEAEKGMSISVVEKKGEKEQDDAQITATLQRAEELELDLKRKELELKSEKTK